MALQLSFTTPSDILLPTAYAHIAGFGGTKEGLQLQITVWKDAAARLANKQPVAAFSQKIALTDGATMDQMYTALKLQSLFTSATNV